MGPSGPTRREVFASPSNFRPRSHTRPKARRLSVPQGTSYIRIEDRPWLFDATSSIRTPQDGEGVTMDASPVVPTSEGSEGLASTLGAGHALDADDVSLGSVLGWHFFSPQIYISFIVYKEFGLRFFRLTTHLA